MESQMYMRPFSTDTAYWSLPAHFEYTCTKLWEAVQKFDRSCFEQLADNLSLVQITDTYHNSILHCAAAVGNSDVIAYVLRKPMNAPPVNAINSHGYTALQKALTKMKFSSNPDQKFRETVRLLLEAGADPRLPYINANGLATAGMINCPVTINMLYCSMVQREPCKIQLMLRFKDAGWKLKHFMWTRDLQLMKLFIDSDRSILSMNKGSFHVMHLAVEARVPAAFFELLVANYNLDPNYRDCVISSTPLHRLCELADEWLDLDVLEKLLELGANPNLTNSRGQNCLHLAAKAGSDLVVRLLLKYNVETDIYDLAGKNAMHYAAIGGSKAVIATLHGTGLSALDRCRSDDSPSALHLASYYCHPEVVAYLLRLGLNPNDLDCKGMTPMHYAVMEENLMDRRIKTVDALVEYGANLYHDNNPNLSQLKYCLEQNLESNATLITRYFALAQSRAPKLAACIMSEIMEDQNLKKVYDDCLVELEAMKNYEVFGWASMHTILTAPLKVIRSLMRNSDVVKTMYRCIIDRTIHKRFPMYCTQIIERFSRYKEEQRRVSFACEGLSDLFGHWDSSGIIAKNVVKFLGEDIDALVEHRIEMTAKNMLKFRITDN